MNHSSTKFWLTALSLIYLMVALPMSWITEQTFLALMIVILGMYKVANVAEKRVLK